MQSERQSVPLVHQNYPVFRSQGISCYYFQNRLFLKCEAMFMGKEFLRVRQ